ncbi:MAG: transposase [Rubrobacter sp.]|nr:transposase [Rubrobacter sp.]
MRDAAFRNEASFAVLCGGAPLPASSGKTRRYLLNHGGDRAADCALHMAAISHLRLDPASATTRPDAPPRVFPRRRSCAASNATWLVKATSYCATSYCDPSPHALQTQLDTCRSFRGVQYTSLSFGKELKEAGIVPSMGRAGSAYDYSLAESFVATLKTELVHRDRWRLPGKRPGRLLCRVHGRLLQPLQAALSFGL